ncbi:MAG TPA: ABC transporter permease subunit [Acidimicrobiales bacterium]|nr:ABC transporter permease subunit [Acidimicrobiales bacterium]
MIGLFLTEVRRDLSRRLVWVLVGLALLGAVVAGGIAFANAEGSPGRRAFVQCTATPSGETVCSESFGEPLPPQQFELTELWPEDTDEGPLLAVPIVFLAIGGLLAGASTVGAEWRAGTIATLLTWEPRRTRVAAAKLLAAGLLAFLIAFVLLALFCLALLPAGLRGSTAGTDASWLSGLVVGMLRGSALTALTAVFGAGVAMVGRNTAAAFGVAFAYLVIGENVVRAWKPRLTRWLIGENAATFLLGGAPDDAPFRRGAGPAFLTIAVYVGVVAVAAIATFRARDVASTG